jgi:hypothetical protein
VARKSYQLLVMAAQAAIHASLSKRSSDETAIRCSVGILHQQSNC